MSKSQSNYVSFFLFMLFTQCVFGQCPTVDTLNFNTQQQIDDFLSDYPDCTIFNGDVLVEGDSIFNLNGLQNLSIVEGYFHIRDNDALLNPSGLNSLTIIGGDLKISYTTALTNLNGLENLTTIGGDFSVFFNNELINLTGLENLSSIGENLYFYDNFSLVNLNGLESLSSIGGFLRIYDHGILTHLNALESLSFIGGYLEIHDNSYLTNLSGLDNLSWIGEDLNIYNNDALTSLSGLEALNSIGGFLNIYSNDALSNLHGLGNLASTGEYVAIKFNHELIDLTGLEKLTSIGSYLEIYGNNGLSTLTGLENLDSIGGSLWIKENEALVSMSNLENLSYIGNYLRIENNELLTNLSGLENVTSIEGYLSVKYNDILTSLNGLENLTSIGGYCDIQYNDGLINPIGLEHLTSVGRTLKISNNNSLINLSGLEHLTSIGEDIEITYNPSLTTIYNLENLTSIGENIKVYDNPSLVLCRLPIFCEYLGTGVSGNYSIEGNGPGCNDLEDILARCDELAKVNIYCYYDLNENGLQENNEVCLSNVPVTIQPNGLTIYGNGTEGALKYLYYGNYTIELNENNQSDWTLASGTFNYDVSLDSMNNSDTLYFGLTPNNILTNVSTHGINGLPRCNEYVLFEPMIHNNGTTTADGTLWFTLDENVLDVNFIDLPDTTDGTNRYGWHFTYLYPQQVFKKQISIQLPGPPDFPIGDELTFQIGAQFSDQLQSNANVNNAHRVTVECSYDPNDKLVQTSNPYNYSLTGEDLIYTVRFQNTGNAEAYDVVIKDLLSENLDMSTFKYLTSSHESVLSTYLDDRMLTFEFRDIFLPDSTTNFDESQGYVMYSIRAKEALSDFSTVENTANIFFDYNPAVVTNTTENIMVESFDADEDGFEVWIDCDDNNEFVNIEEEIPYNGLDDDCDETTLDDDLDQDGFGIAEDCDDNNPLINSDAQEIPNNGIDEDCDGQDLIVSAKEILTIKPQIFPNPTNGHITILLPRATTANLQIKDYNGRTLAQQQLVQEQELDLGYLTAGVYVLVIKMEGDVFVERLVLLIR